MKNWVRHNITALLLLASGFAGAQDGVETRGKEELGKYVQWFNAIDSEYAVNYIPNQYAQSWMQDLVPLFHSPDTLLNRIYYYRWWALRKHLKLTTDGFVFTEFITQVNHAGKHNTVSSALGHHIMELRWLRDDRYLNEYLHFWLSVDPTTKKPHLRAFSSWLQYALYNRFLVNRDSAFVRENIHLLDADYRAWEKDRKLPSGLFWQFDVRDAMEESISGGRKEQNRRPTINSYMYGNAKAMAQFASLVKNDTLTWRYTAEMVRLGKLVHDSLWDGNEYFFKVRHADGRIEDAREQLGFIPWYFNLPADRKAYARQWEQLLDTAGFRAPWGITTAERRHPGFRTHGSGHGCEWDGAVWPYATTQTLKGLSNLLTNYKNKGKMNAGVFYDELYKYAWSHQKRGLPYLGEYQDEKTGYWLKGDNPRSSYYNHSSFADLVIADLVGLKPRADDVLELHPLIPEGKWAYFFLDKVHYHGKLLRIVWDKSGTQYGLGKGLRIYADGQLIYSGSKLKPVKIKLRN